MFVHPRPTCDAVTLRILLYTSYAMGVPTYRCAACGHIRRDPKPPLFGVEERDFSPLQGKGSQAPHVDPLQVCLKRTRTA